MSRQPATTPTPTDDDASTIDAWYQEAEEGRKYRLPGSGLIAKLRRPGLTGMITRAGHVPNPISGAVLRLLAKQDDPLAKPSEDEMIAAYLDNAEAFQQIAALAFVYPRLVLDREPNRADGEIGPQHVANLDYIFIVYQLVEGYAAKLLPFQIA